MRLSSMAALALCCLTLLAVAAADSTTAATVTTTEGLTPNGAQENGSTAANSAASTTQAIPATSTSKQPATTFSSNSNQVNGATSQSSTVGETTSVSVVIETTSAASADSTASNLSSLTSDTPTLITSTAQASENTTSFSQDGMVTSSTHEKTETTSPFSTTSFVTSSSSATTTANVVIASPTTDDNNSTTTQHSSLSTNEGTTVQLTSTASVTTTMADIGEICGVSVKDVPEDSPCHPTFHQSVSLNSKECHNDQLMKGKWIRFADCDSSCQQIPVLTSNDSCVKPGSCNSQFPYHISTDQIPPSNTSRSAKLCTTDRSKSRRFYCCQDPIDVEMMNCAGRFFIYKFTSKLFAEPCAKVCLSKTESFPPFTGIVKDGSEAQKKMENLNGGFPPFTGIVKDGSEAQKKMENLNEKEKENLVSFKLIIVNISAYEKVWDNVTKSLVRKLTEILEENCNKRQKSETETTNVVVEVIDGYPQINVTTMEAIYVLYVHDANGVPLPKDCVQSAVKSLEGQDVLDSGSGSKVGELIELEESIQDNGSNLWIAIIIIVGVTAFIVAVSFIVMWCYSFSRKGKYASMQVSQYKEGLVGGDELNNSYKLTGGHVNAAMEDDAMVVDSNQNTNAKTTKDKNNIEMQRVDENTV